jgi:hypothetical protein
VPVAETGHSENDQIRLVRVHLTKAKGASKHESMTFALREQPLINAGSLLDTMSGPAAARRRPRTGVKTDEPISLPDRGPGSDRTGT